MSTVEMMESIACPRAMEWQGEVDGMLQLIDQTLLPMELAYVNCQEETAVFEAIVALRVRGAPAIGISAAYGLVLGVRRQDSGLDAESFLATVRQVSGYLASSRPTAVNLFWALRRMEAKAETVAELPTRERLAVLLEEAHAIRDEDRDMCAAIGRHGATLIEAGSGVLTHCNTGALATADLGTALAVVFTAHAEGKNITVYVDETRPLLQGSRLTAWELKMRGVPSVLICDNMAAWVMKQGRVKAAIVGADRIASNGDTANKIGTYSVAVLARAHGIPFYVAAPSSTFDFALTNGEEIPIEFRKPEEITEGFGRRTAPEGVDVFNPAFDVTPGKLITAFITEKGVIQPPYTKNLAETLGRSGLSTDLG